MPRKDAPFEYEGQWLGRERPDGPWYRYWREGRRVRRRSTGEKDLEAAKPVLVAAVATTPAVAGDPAEVMMAAVFNHYLDTVVVPKRKRPEKQTRAEADIRRYFRRVIDHMSARSPNKEGFSAAAFDIIRQRELARILFGEGQSPKSISNLLVMARAALGHAAKDKAVETGAGEKVVRLLRYAPTVMTSEAEVAALVGGTVSRQRQFIPTLDETAKVIDAIQHEHMFRYVIIALTTWARPSTILELDVEKQVDFRFGVVDLLPVEKRQTNKRRPIIPLVPTLRGWLEHWNTRYPVLWGGEKIVEINDAFRTIVRPMGLPKFTPYTLRHLANSEALARGGIGEERSRMLGHLPKSQAATTAWYEHGTVANYLKSCVDATESLIDDLEARCRRPLRAPKSLPQATLRLVSN